MSSSSSSKRPLHGFYDNDDDDDGSHSPRIIPHAKRAMQLLGVTSSVHPEQFEMAGGRSFVEIQELRDARNNRGYYADDGLPVPRGVHTTTSAVTGAVTVTGPDANSAFGTNYINERLARQRVLDANPYYRFIRQVASGQTLETLIDEAAISQETSERIRLAKAQLHRQQQRSQDSSAEQERIRKLREQSDAERDEHDNLKAKKQRFETARASFIDAMKEINSVVGDGIVDAGNTYQSLFDRFTRVGCARYGAGGYRKTLLEARSIAEQMHQRTLAADEFKLSDAQVRAALVARETENVIATAIARNNELKSRADQLRKSMPKSSLAALLWATLLVVSQNSALLERIRMCGGGGALFAAGAGALYNNVAATGSKTASAMAACVPDVGGGASLHGGANLYVDDLIALANLVFDNDQTDDARRGTNNLLLVSELSQLLWAHVNKMLERAGSKQAPLDKPSKRPPAPPQGGAQRRVIAGLDIVFEVSDEDARLAAQGEELAGVPQEKLAEARSTLYVNTDQARSLDVLVELLQPMLALCYPMLFYANEALFDDGFDVEAFAGGFSENALYIFERVPRAAALAGSHLAFVGILNLSDAIIRASVRQTALRKEDVGALLEQGLPSIADVMAPAMLNVMTVSNDTRRAYNKRVVDRLLRRERALDAFAQYAALGDEIQALDAFTATELALLKRYIELAGKHTPGTTRASSGTGAAAADAALLTDKQAFVAAENAAMGVFVNARPVALPAVGVREEDIDKFKDALSTSQRFLFHQAKTPANERMRRLNRRIAEHGERAAQLQQDWRALHDRQQEWIKRTAAENAADIEAILKGDRMVEFVPTASVAMAPLNSGVIILTTLAVSAIADAYDYLSEFVPCITSVAYTDSDDLVESDTYYVAFARLMRVQMRLTDAEFPDTYRPDKTEQRSRLSRKSALNSLRALARADPRISHFQDARCTCFGLGSTAGSGRIMPASQMQRRGL